MKWLTYERGTIPLHRAAIVLVGLFRYADKLQPYFADTLYINEGERLIWNWNKKQLNELGRRLLQEVSSEKNLDKHIERLKKYIKRGIKAGEKVIGTDLKNLGDDELLKMYRSVIDEAALSQGATMLNVDAFDVVFEKFFQTKIKGLVKEKVKKGELEKLVKKLSMPAYRSYITTQEKELIKLALKKFYTEDDIDKIQKKYYWTNLGWEGMRPHTMRYFENLIRRYGQNKKLAREKLSEITGWKRKINKEREKLIEEYKMSKEIWHWLKAIDIYSWLHDVRKEQNNKQLYAIYLILKEIARRRKYKIEDLEWLWFDEVEEFFVNRKINQKEIGKRKKAAAVLITKKGIKTWSGDDARKIRKQELPDEKHNNTAELHGLGVTPGKIKGRVRVCQGVKDATRKIKSKRDILVCPMTVPDYVPAMKRAGAIVTNEGGVTCHAAIISREFDIPCVLGTKVATKVFKDGDLVEVDATGGVVRKTRNKS